MRRVFPLTVVGALLLATPLAAQRSTIDTSVVATRCAECLWLDLTRLVRLGGDGGDGKLLTNPQGVIRDSSGRFLVDLSDRGLAAFDSTGKLIGFAGGARGGPITRIWRPTVPAPGPGHMRQGTTGRLWVGINFGESLPAQSDPGRGSVSAVAPSKAQAHAMIALFEWNSGRAIASAKLDGVFFRFIDDHHLASMGVTATGSAFIDVWRMTLTADRSGPSR